jgi:hypothetical protein
LSSPTHVAGLGVPLLPLDASALLGRVATYDGERGLGTVESMPAAPGPATRLYPFHCTAIADGSRRIEPGTPVTFVAVPGLGGIVEARALTTVLFPTD